MNSTYDCTLQSCWLSVQRALEEGWYNKDTFSAESYNKYTHVDVANLNWIIPNKFLASMSPLTSITKT